MAVNKRYDQLHNMAKWSVILNMGSFGVNVESFKDEFVDHVTQSDLSLAESTLDDSQLLAKRLISGEHASNFFRAKKINSMAEQLVDALSNSDEILARVQKSHPNENLKRLKRVNAEQYRVLTETALIETQIEKDMAKAVELRSNGVHRVVAPIVAALGLGHDIDQSAAFACIRQGMEMVKHQSRNKNTHSRFIQDAFMDHLAFSFSSSMARTFKKKDIEFGTVLREKFNLIKNGIRSAAASVMAIGVMSYAAAFNPVDSIDVDSVISIANNQYATEQVVDFSVDNAMEEFDLKNRVRDKYNGPLDLKTVDFDRSTLRYDNSEVALDTLPTDNVEIHTGGDIDGEKNNTVNITSTKIIVKQGDTLSGVAHRALNKAFGDTLALLDSSEYNKAIYSFVDKIADANNIGNADVIYTGQTIDISIEGMGISKIEGMALNDKIDLLADISDSLSKNKPQSLAFKM